MPASLKSITSKRATVSVPVEPDDPDGDQVRVTYRPKAFTPRVYQRFAEMQANSTNEWESGPILVEMFIRIVDKWDLRADAEDEDPIPLTAEGLADVPVALMSSIIGEAISDQQPDPTTKKS